MVIYMWKNKRSVFHKACLKLLQSRVLFLSEEPFVTFIWEVRILLKTRFLAWMDLSFF